MTPLVFAALALAGGAGAACRLLLDGLIRTRTVSALPWGTIVVNLSGSLLLGLVTGLTAGRILDESVHLVVGAGFLGGYTTFSTASFETIRLLQERRLGLGLLNGLGVLIGATAVAGLGIWLGTLL